MMDSFDTPSALAETRSKVIKKLPKKVKVFKTGMDKWHFTKVIIMLSSKTSLKQCLKTANIEDSLSLTLLITSLEHKPK